MGKRYDIILFLHHRYIVLKTGTFVTLSTAKHRYGSNFNQHSVPGRTGNLDLKAKGLSQQSKVTIFTTCNTLTTCYDTDTTVPSSFFRLLPFVCWLFGVITSAR